MDLSALSKNALIVEVIQLQCEVERLKRRNKELERLLELEVVPTEVYNFLVETIIALSSIIRQAEPGTGNHQDRVAILSRAMAIHMGLTQRQIDTCSIGGQLHDIGKIDVQLLPLVISGKKLNAKEWSDMQDHPEIGAEILDHFKCPWDINNIVKTHHERLNGSGYPIGKTAKDISLEARLVSIADVVEAMCTERPYREETPGLQRALEYIEENSGTLFDPDGVIACRELFEDKGFVFPAAISPSIIH